MTNVTTMSAPPLHSEFGDIAPRAIMRLVFDCTNCAATTSDAVELARLLQQAIRGYFRGHKSLTVLIARHRDARYRLHFVDVLFCARPYHSTEHQIPHELFNLLDLVRRQQSVMFQTPTTTDEPKPLRVDVDRDALSALCNGQQPLVPTRADDVVAVLSSDGSRVYTMNNVQTGDDDDKPWWQSIMPDTQQIGKPSAL